MCYNGVRPSSMRCAAETLDRHDKHTYNKILQFCVVDGGVTMYQMAQCLSNNTHTHHCYQQWSRTHYSTPHTLWARTVATILADAAVTSPSPK